MNKIVGVVMIVVIVATGLAGVAFGTTCRTEDSVHCIWYGPLQGNHKGKIVINP